jgi:hypothetical protein
MLKRSLLAWLCVLSFGMSTVVAQEQLLPSSSQLFFRWDGMKAHQELFNKTAVGKLVQGETGTFLKELWKYIKEVGVPEANKLDPQAAAYIADAEKIIEGFYRDGMLFALEVEQVNPPRAVALVVFPKGAGETGTLLPLIQKLTTKGKVDVKDVKVGKRFVHQVNIENKVHIGWWGEGDDAIVCIGTEEAAEYARRIDAKKTGLADHAVYKKIADFKEFTTCTRGFFDMKGVIKVAKDVAPQAEAVIEELGLAGLADITFLSGFDGMYERSIMDVSTPGPRKGLLALSSAKKVNLKDLPKLPHNLTTVSVSSSDVSKTYDSLMKTVEGVVKVFAPNDADNIKEGIKAFEGVLGISLKDDVFAALGDLSVGYSTPSEGFFGLGGVAAMQVKDGKKLANTINTLVKAIPPLPGAEFSLKRTEYKGGEIIDLSMKSEFSSNVASFGFYKGWFVYSSYPQPIKGFIMRQVGELPAWKADENFDKLTAWLPKEYSAMSYTDSRAGVEQVFASLPFLFQIANTALSKEFPNIRPFPVEIIPHAQEVTRNLFPRVSVTTDDGKKVRVETRGSFP